MHPKLRKKALRNENEKQLGKNFNKKTARNKKKKNM